MVDLIVLFSLGFVVGFLLVYFSMRLLLRQPKLKQHYYEPVTRDFVGGPLHGTSGVMPSDVKQFVIPIQAEDGFRAGRYNINPLGQMIWAGFDRRSEVKHDHLP